MQSVKSDHINSPESAGFILLHIHLYSSDFFCTQMCTWGKLDCVPGFYSIEKVLLKLYTSRVQQNPTWNTARTCSIPAPLLHHCLLSPFVRQTATWTLSENLRQRTTRLVQIGFGGKPFRDTSVPRKKSTPSASTRLSVLKHEWWATAREFISLQYNAALRYANAHQSTVWPNNKLNPL